MFEGKLKGDNHMEKLEGRYYLEKSPKWKQADEDAKSKYPSGGWIWALTVDIMAATPNI